MVQVAHRAIWVHAITRCRSVPAYDYLDCFAFIVLVCLDREREPEGLEERGSDG